MLLNPQQREVLSQLKAFISDEATQVFILKGYAGTGKTTLVRYFTDWLTEQKFGFELLATTGRAAKILKDKTGCRTTTIHSAIYSFKDVEGDFDHVKQVAGSAASGQLSLVFGSREPLDDTEPQPVLIVDEASMLSNVPDAGTSYVKFGSGILLDDLFSYANGAKIIFVGDPLQLPPVGSLISFALEKTLLSEKYATGVTEAELTQIMRQDHESGIMSLAGYLRTEAFVNPDVRYPRLPVRLSGHICLHGNREAFVGKYVDQIREKGFEEAICIARTNRECLEINRAVRTLLHGNTGPVRVGDILMVTQNNYLTDIVNGDLVKVKSLKARDERAGIPFMKMEVENLWSNKVHEIWLMLPLLESENPTLSREDHRALMIDFSNRMFKESIVSKSPKFKTQMLKDPFLNALRAQYGYAVTCHKSQGGEWPQIFLLLSASMYGMDRQSSSRDQLRRWLYTAVTRTEKTLHLEEGWWLG